MRSVSRLNCSQNCLPACLSVYYKGIEYLYKHCVFFYQYNSNIFQVTPPTNRDHLIVTFWWLDRNIYIYIYMYILMCVIVISIGIISFTCSYSAGTSSNYHVMYLYVYIYFYQQAYLTFYSTQKWCWYSWRIPLSHHVCKHDSVVFVNYIKWEVFVYRT